jgi:hypothetical protein
LEVRLGNLQVIEPTESEIELAADLEKTARQLGGAFDVGEAQLFAVLLTRGSPALVTGDKRAISAASALRRAPGAHDRCTCGGAKGSEVSPASLRQDHLVQSQIRHGASPIAGSRSRAPSTA